VLGSAVVQSKITALLDVQQAILAADPYFYSRPLGDNHYSADAELQEV
jgi:hypothetical protein